MSRDTQTKDLTRLFETTTEATHQTASPTPEADPLVDPTVQMPPDFFASSDPFAALAEDSAPAPSPAPSPVPRSPAEAVDFSVNPSEPTGAQAFPFSLLISGKLEAHEREKLLEILRDEKITIREVDLQPQLEAGHVLIPRINEFVGIAVVQALRDSRAKITLGPSDHVYATPDSQNSPSDPQAKNPSPDQSSLTTPERTAHLAELLPLLVDEGPYQAFDSVMASLTLEAKIVEAADSPDYERAVEALTRKLRYEAYAKGAHAVIRFSISLTPLHQPSQYRLMAIGMAARHK